MIIVLILQSASLRQKFWLHPWVKGIIVKKDKNLKG